ncbi:MAG: GAF domain-containing sensor histidine kinase [Chloroflexota bacterium]
MNRSSAHASHKTAPPIFAAMDQSPAVMWSAIIAIFVGCGIPLLEGVINNWSSIRLISYIALILLYLLMMQGWRPLPIIQAWCGNSYWSYAFTIGLIGLGLQAISGNYFVQLIVFAIPIVHTATRCTPRQTALIALLYLGLMQLGLWLSGWRDLPALTIPLIALGSLMVFMYAFTRVSIDQAEARQQADTLAHDLARERDYLRRLVDVTATLTSDIDLTSVLSKMASEGRILAQASIARVWLHEENEDPQAAPNLHLAATVSQNGVLPAEAPLPASNTTLLLQLVAKGVHIGTLELHRDDPIPFTANDKHRLQPFVDVAAIAIVNARLYEQSRLSATLAERNRLARDLHDTIAQGLTAINMQLEAAQKNFARDPSRAQTRVGRAHELARETLKDVRRSVWDLASPLIDGERVSDELTRQVEQFANRTGIRAHYQHSGPPIVLDNAVAVQIVRIVQEALKNVEKHARASEVTVTSTTNNEHFRIHVHDNGIGFTPQMVVPQSGAKDQGFGLHSLRERARLVGGALQIASVPEQGTDISIDIARETL